MSLKTSLRLKQRRKAGDPWVSNNRVLNGMAKKLGNFGRNPNFDTDETKLLIQLWGDPKVQRALITTHKKHAVISQLAQKMQDFGYYRSPEEITTRIKNLKCFYNRIKKDIETGQESSSKPSWKHFDEMDAIMTRPIFSVRPDEVPPPCMKFRLEQAREQLAERRKLMKNEGTLGPDSIPEDSDDFFDEDSMELEERQQELESKLVPDVELDVDINDTVGALANVGNGSCKLKRSKRLKISHEKEECNELVSFTTVKDEETVELKSDTDVQTESAKNEENVSQVEKEEDKNETDLLEPKQEPIDVDAEDSIDQVVENAQQISEQPQTAKSVTQLMPTLADILQISQDSLTAGNISTNSKVLNPTSSGATSTMGSDFTATVTTTANSQPLTGKISLVPTNFLMQSNKNVTTRVVNASTAATMSQPQQIHLLQSTPQQRILFSNSTATQGAAMHKNSGIMTTGPGGMKVLLLSAEQAAAATAATKTLGTFLPLNSTNLLQLQQPLAMQQQQLQQQQLPTSTNTQTQASNLLKPTQNSPKINNNSTTNTNTNNSSPVISKVNEDKQSSQNKMQTKKKTQTTEPQPLLQQKEHRPQQRQEMTAHSSTQQQQQQQESPFTKKDATNLRILLRQLLNAQYESNAINSRRWKLERDRLEFEKSVADRFFTAMPNFFDTLKQTFQPNTTPTEQTQTTTVNPTNKQSTQAPQSQIYQATPFLKVSSASQLRMQPPKLLFTAVRHPSIVTTQNTFSLCSPTIPPTLPKVTTSTSITESELLVPKEEPQDN